MPASDRVARGEFSYAVIGLDGKPLRVSLVDPPRGECITLPEVADPGSSSPAFAPANNTDALATAWTNPDCSGEYVVLQPHGEPQARGELRSVRFDLAQADE
ncbi:hypothetical protein AB0B78_23240 [Streptomyces sp. NPDC040724]|uniref:hypothetical protein n=1 Tax=Streptomyces sp. NPDC040724 TaxID=3155612 RepID=UPI003401127D